MILSMMIFISCMSHWEDMARMNTTILKLSTLDRGLARGKK